MKYNKNVGDRINLFENALTNDVKTFNMIFRDYPLDFSPHEEIEIGEIVKVNCYKLTCSGKTFEHYFERRKLDESIMPNDFSDDDDF